VEHRPYGGITDSDAGGLIQQLPDLVGADSCRSAMRQGQVEEAAERGRAQGTRRQEHGAERERRAQAEAGEVPGPGRGVATSNCLATAAPAMKVPTSPNFRSLQLIWTDQRR
jgi:hypothetical protein